MDQTDPRNSDVTKYFILGAVGITALFLGYLWGNQTKIGRLSVGKEGVHIEVSDRERIEAIIDKIIDDREGRPYERSAMIEHMMNVIKRHTHDTDVGKKIVGAVKDGSGPFEWGYEDAEIRYKEEITAPVFYVCNETRRLHGEISVQVWDAKKNEFLDVGKELHGLPFKNCGTSRYIVYTGYKDLAAASRLPGRLAKVRPVVTFPR